MATVTVHDDVLSLRLTRAEKILGLLRDVDVPISAVTSVDVVDPARTAVRGVRAPGYALPGHRLVGTWRGSSRLLVAVRPRRPALRVVLAGQRHDELVVEVGDPHAIAGAISRAVADSA